MNRIFAILVLLVLLIQPAFAQTVDPNKLESLTERQKQAEAQAKELTKRQKTILGEIGNLQDDLITASGQARGFERAETKARAQLSDLSAQEKALNATILSDRAALSDMLAALQRIDKSPPPALLVHPQNATDAARAAHLLAYLSRNLHEKSKLLQDRLSELHGVRTTMDRKRGEISSHAKNVNVRLTRIKSIITDKSALNNKLDKDRKTKTDEAARLAKEAKNLRDLIARFEDSAEAILPRLKPDRSTRDPVPRLKPTPGRAKTPNYVPPVFIPSGSARFADARGQVPLPVFGKLSRRYGARLAGGGTAKGISLKSTRRAQVIAPFAGRVEFSGAFNDDYVVILNVGGGYFIVLTGLGETFAKAGTRVKAGEPLGLMPTTGTKSPELFMEFRKNRSSINPKPWVGA
ncbi:MAG: peptidoglycan DD-metalloendopeptidase family protein, partial [Robiginitomaculum sp.]|nr:peptidoglycan DD-metalloendopeptidase family protein [Robiginitomaculum sp.]